jgi:uncharacterized membrane protein
VQVGGKCANASFPQDAHFSKLAAKRNLGQHLVSSFYATFSGERKTIKILEMINNLKRIWKDPVGSAVIAGLVLAALSILYNAIKAYYYNTNFIYEFQKLWFLKISLWLVVVIVFAIFLISFVKRKKSKKEFDYDIETLELDRKLFNRIRNELITKETLDDLNGHLFSNHSFERTKFDFIYQTLKASEDPEFEFLNPELDNAKDELIEALKKFQSSTFGTIYSAPSQNDTGFYGIPREWDRERFYAAMDKIDPEETNVFKKAVTLIKKGRRILKI